MLQQTPNVKEAFLELDTGHQQPCPHQGKTEAETWKADE